jgi:hypothetical protein
LAGFSTSLAERESESKPLTRGRKIMKVKNFYLWSLLAVVLVSVYPIYMGVVTLGNYLQKGSITTADYPKYIIPYTPLCIALIFSVALIPSISKLLKRYTLAVISILGILIFFASEIGFEQIKVNEGYVEMPLQSWQLSLCAATPQVLRAIGEPIYATNNPSFKIHFYIIAVIIILAVLNVIFGFSQMLKEQAYSKKNPLVAQAIAVTVFIGLCILACFTAFYRNGTINISPLSSTLMTVFFIVFGITSGIYCGSIFYRKSMLLSQIIPSMIASLTTLIMYIGELVLTGGVLYKYGSGFLFQSLGVIPLSVIDIVIILTSGMITHFVLHILNNKRKIA